MQSSVLQGILIPFLGTTLGSACVLFMKKSLNPMLQGALTMPVYEALQGADIICLDYYQT